MISDDLDHIKLSVNDFIKKLFSTLKEQHTSIKMRHVYSDGASPQFKERSLLSNLFRWNNDLANDWHFFGTSHGLGAY